MRMLVRATVVLVGAALAVMAWKKSQEEGATDAKDAPRPPVPEPDPAASPAPAASSPPDEVPPSSPEVDPVVRFANTADDAALAAAGLTSAAVKALVGGRPFEDLDALAATRGVGPKSLAALSAAVGE